MENIKKNLKRDKKIPCRINIYIYFMWKSILADTNGDTKQSFLSLRRDLLLHIRNARDDLSSLDEKVTVA